MSKQKFKSKVQPLPLTPVETIFPSQFRIQAMIILVIGFIFYANSLLNQYALDDGIVIEKNEYVQKGLKGIGKILSTDAYDSFYKQMGSDGQLSGGRYRPLSIVTFAIEQQFFGNNPFIRHLLNVGFYLLSLVILLYFLNQFIFKEDTDLAFLTTLIFAIHPIHTEVIANVKSRDEILSFLFIILTFVYAFRYLENKKIPLLFKGLLCYFLALLSKEYAITLLILIPVMFYLFKGYDAKKSLLAVLPFAFIAFIYLAIRFSIVGAKHFENSEVLNNPFIYATTTQKWASKIYILDNYLKLLFFPHPLSSDYSYSQISYKTFGNPGVWLSIIVHLGIAVSTVMLLKRKHFLAFAGLFYLLHLMLVCNLVMDIGATMGERLIYHSSFGFAMAIAFLMLAPIKRWIPAIKTKKIVLIALLVVITIFCGFKTMERNAIWRNDITLFITDVETVPNSVLANGNAGARYIDLSEKPENKDRETEFVNKAIVHLEKAIAIHPKYVNGYLNLGIAYYKQKDYIKTEAAWKKAEQLYPHHPLLKTYYPTLAIAYLNKARELGPNKAAEAIAQIGKALEFDPNNAEIWYNLGGAYFTIKEFDKAKQAWLRTLELNPNHPDVRNGLAALPK